MTDTENPSLAGSRSRWWFLDPVGAVGGITFAVLSVTPSLLPRPTVLQGALAAIAFALGYLLLTALWALIRKLLWPADKVFRFHRAWWVAYGMIWLFAFSFVPALALSWQNEVHALVMMPPLETIDVTYFLLTFLPLTFLLLTIGKAILRMFYSLKRKVRAPKATAISAAIITSMLATMVFLAMAGIDRIYFERNSLPDTDIAEPASEFRSAGEASAISWSTLGRHGGAFIAGGPSAEAITELSGKAALQPIRVYAGLDSAATIAERANLVVAELERTGAFDRKILVVATTTGSGWLEPQTVDAIEYLYSGDTAIASMQYAYTPSWVSFLFQPDAPVAAAQVLFEKIEERLQEIPEAERPLLVAYGLSLGAHGSQAVFKDLADVRARTNAAMFVGSPNSSVLWRTLQASRDAGSPVTLPVLDEGLEVRWISRVGDESALDGPWMNPRVLYLQHATDPVTWLSPELLYKKPSWLKSTDRSQDISPAMRWIPLVTALLVTVDMLGGEAVPAQFGHNYGDVVVTGWISILGDPGIGEAAIERIQTEIERYAPISSFDE